MALGSREALFLAAPGPVLMYAADGRLVRANALAREQPMLITDPPPPELAVGIARILGGDRPRRPR